MIDAASHLSGPYSAAILGYSALLHRSVLDEISGRIRFFGVFPVDLPTALLRDLQELSCNVGLPDNSLTAPSNALVIGLQAAIPSYRGLHLRIVDHGYAVTLTAFVPPDRQVTTSLRLPLAALDPGFQIGSVVVFYAATPGAFVDLAADLAYALGLPTSTAHVSAGPASGRADAGDRHGQSQAEGREVIMLDADLPPASLVSGLTGLHELSTINRAVGILIHQGHHPSAALDTLRRRAAKAGVEPLEYAAALLQR